MSAINDFGLERVMILDWVSLIFHIYVLQIINLCYVLIKDIHHGNGTQEIFYETKKVLHVSIHRQQFSIETGEDITDSMIASFNEAGLADKIGRGEGLGFNVNVPLGEGDKEGAGLVDADYMTIFEKIVTPLAREFKPEMIFVAAGFDAGILDRHLPVGGYSLTPECYSHMTSQLLNVAQDGKVAMCLEGGYNTEGLSSSVAEVLSTLINYSEKRKGEDAKVSLSEDASKAKGDEDRVHEDTYRAIEEVRMNLAPYWKCMR
jgi:histone deacetylase 6